MNGSSLRSLARASTLFAATVLVGCAYPASNPSEEHAAASSEVSHAAGAHRQTLPYLPESVLAGAIESFRVRNGTTWQPKSAWARMNTNPLTGSVTSMVRRAPYGSDVDLTADAAIDTAREFFVRNADLLGVTEPELRAATPATFRIASGDYRWIVKFRAAIPLPGYEAFADVISKSIDIQVSIARDGTPRDLSSHVSSFPGLALSTTPELDANDPLVSNGVLGRELVWTEHSGTYVDPVVTTTPLGAITPNDIVARKLTIFVAPAEDATTLTLAYRLDVKRGGHDFVFFVDSSSGAVL